MAVLHSEEQRRLGSQNNLYVDAVRDLNPHELPQRALVRVEVYEPLVHAHLPSINSA